MTLRHLKIFLTLYETKSTVITSKKLLVSQPTISIALKELEEYYGVKFFERFSQRLHITRAGEEMYQYAKHIISLVEETEISMKDIKNSGNLIIGSSITIGNYFLATYIKNFQKENPNTKIKVIIDNSKNIEKLLLENKIDIGLIEGEIQNPFIISIPYRKDFLYIICNPNHPYANKEKITLKDIISEKLILREKGSAVRDLFDIKMENLDIKIEPLWQSISTHAIIRAVKENIGISVLPYFLIKEYVEKGEIKILETDEINFSRNFNIIYHKNKFHSIYFDKFIEICKNSTI